MSDPPLIRAFSEGDDDFVVAKELHAAGILPTRLDPARSPKQSEDPKRPPGHDGLAYDATKQAGEGGLHAILLRDWDHFDVAGLSRWLQAELERWIDKKDFTIDELDARFPRATFASGGQAIVVPVGRRGDADLISRFDLEAFSIDDYLLLLSLEQPVFEACTDLNEIPYALAVAKLEEIRRLMSNNQLPIRRSKRLLQHLWALTGFRASPATMAEQVVKAAVQKLGANQTTDLFQPLVQDVADAIAALSP